MATITTRVGKGSPLTNNEVDSNFTNLNTDKVETSAIGTAAAADTGDFATAEQGTLAANAVQPNDSPTFGAVTATSYAGDGSALTGLPAGYTDADVDTHLNTSTASNGEVLSWTGTDYDWIAAATGGSGYADSNVDTHLNFSTATSGQILSYNGTDYDWIDAVDTNTTYVSSDFTHDDLSGFVANEHIDWTTDQGTTNIHANNYTDTNTTYQSSDFDHDSLNGFVANEHIDWTTDQGATNIHSGNYTNTTYTVGDGGLTTNDFTTALKDKLDGVDALADVTNATNVTTAGALMDSEVTNLAQVKAFDSTDYATAAQGTKADAALPKTGGAMTGAITTTSTFDGRDVATDGTKLDGIEASADVTDTANVTAAGALMDSEVTNLAQVKAFDSTDYVAVTGDTMTGHLSFGDNDKAIFGAGSDLQIYHDGSSSIITESGAGNLKIQGSNIEFLSATGEDYANFLANGAVRLYYDNAMKLATTSTGIDVTGTVTATAFVGDGSGLTNLPSSGSYGNSDVDAHLNFSTATSGQILSYNGSDYDWIAAAGGDLLAANNLSDLVNASTARTNLGLGTAATTASTAYATSTQGTTADNALPKAGGTMTGDIVVKGVRETNFALSGTTPAIDPANGTIQTWTLSGASTPTFAAGWSANEGITLMINDGSASAITWPTMQWAGGSAPTLPTTGYAIVTVWKEGTVYYGVSAGDMS